MPEAFTSIDSSKADSLPAGPKKGPRGEVALFAKWCKGCHICVEFCPAGVLAMNPEDNHPHVAAPEKCTACHFCDTHCPDLAIVVRKLE
jgi:2-oxoglutarate ferredoxin oxidoreductase subunit delta